MRQKNPDREKLSPRRTHPGRTDLKRIILLSLKQHGIRTGVSFIVIAASVILEVIPPLILAKAVDELTADTAVSLALGAEYFLLLAASGLLDAAKEALIVANGESITHALRTAMADKMHRLPASYYTKHEAGKISSVQVNDVDAIEEMFSSGIVSMVCDLGTICSILVVIFTRSPGLGVIVLIVLPLLASFTRHVRKKMLEAHTENRRATAQASGILPETLHIMRSLRVYHAEDFAEKRYDSTVRKSFRAIEKTNFYDAVYSPVIMTVSAAVIGVMMSLSGMSGAFRSWFGMSVGTAVAVISYVNQVFTPLSSIGMEIQAIQAAAAGWNRVQEFLDEDENPEADRTGVLSAAPADRTAAQAENKSSVSNCVNDGPAGQKAIEIRNVSFSYDGGRPVLDNFSLSIEKGEFVTLTGRTGAGKSTLFKLLLGLYEPDSGSISIEGKHPSEFDAAERRRTICCVQQRAAAVPGTVRDQITLGNRSYGDDEIWKSLETAGLGETVRSLPQQLDTPYRDTAFSQGQKQLLMIARATVSDPGILLLDEITAGLDSATESAVITALLKASADRTVLSISHRLSGIISGKTVRLQSLSEKSVSITAKTR